MVTALPMATPDPAIRDHKAWRGYVQQEGLVVSPAALVDAQVVLDRNTLPMQERFRPLVKEVTLDGKDPVSAIADFPVFAFKDPGPAAQPPPLAARHLSGKAGSGCGAGTGRLVASAAARPLQPMTAEKRALQ